MLDIVNNTILVLIPKVKQPQFLFGYKLKWIFVWFIHNQMPDTNQCEWIKKNILDV